MQTKKNVNWFLLLAICLSVTAPGFGADTPERLYRTLRPCIDDQTFAVVHVDLARLDLDVLTVYAVNLVNKHASGDAGKRVEADLSNIRAAAGPRLEGLTKAGARDIFLVFSMYDFPYFFAAIPIPSNADSAGLHEYVQNLAKDFSAREGATHVSGRLIMAGLQRTITRLKTISPAQSSTLEAALRTCADKTVKVVLFPSSDQRRILAEMMPNVLGEPTSVQPTKIAEDLQWAALGLDGPPSVSLGVTIQSPSAEGAGRTLALVKGLYALAAQYPEARRLIPDLDRILERLTPRRQGERLSLQIDSAAADLLIDDVVAPSLLRLDAMARRLACGTNMSGLGKALLIHANDYDDELPADLETLSRTAEVTTKSMICPATGLRESYIYRGAGLTTSAIPMMVTVYETAGNHGEDGRNVLFLDSHVEWVTEERFQELIAKDNEYRREKGLPVLPAK